MMRLAAWLACLCFAMPVWAAPQSVVSLNLCTDQLALSMLDASRLKGVSVNAADPALSLLSGVARKYPLLHGSAEELVAIRPDLVLMGAGQNSPLRQWLAANDIPLLAIGGADSVPAVQQEVGMVAGLLGRPDFADNLRSRQNAAIRQSALPRKGMKVAIYYPRGFSDGEGTLLHDLVKRLGGVNVAAAQGRQGMTYLALEELVALAPDVLLIPLYEYDVSSQAQEVLSHPALKRLRAHVVPLPGQYLTCPHLGLEAMATAIGTTVRQPLPTTEGKRQ